MPPTGVDCALEDIQCQEEFKLEDLNKPELTINSIFTYNKDSVLMFTLSH